MVTEDPFRETFWTMSALASQQETTRHPSRVTNNSDFPLAMLDAHSFNVLDSVLASPHRPIFVSLVIDANRKGKNTWSLLKLVSTFTLFLFCERQLSYCMRSSLSLSPCFLCTLLFAFHLPSLRPLSSPSESRRKNKMSLNWRPMQM